MNLLKTITFRFVLVFFLFTLPIFGETSEWLRTENIREIMKQILDQHIEKREISSSIISKSFNTYIEQFDPERVYLLAGEIRPFLEPSQAQMNRYLKEYKNDHFTSYEKLDLLIQAAIERSRQWREEFKEESDELFQEASSHRTYRQWGEKENIDFANDFSELKKRIRKDFVEFIEVQKSRFGPRQVMTHQERVFQLYENEMRDHEDAYMSYGLNPEEKEHRFSLHVLKALAKSLDSHTRFFDRSEAYDMRVRLEKGYAGIGLIFKEGFENPIVSDMLPNSPSSRNGNIQVNDELIRIDGRSLKDISFEKAMDLLKGEAGSAVVLTLKRGKEGSSKQFDVKLERESLILNQDRVVTTFESFGDGIIGMIALKSFYQNENGISSESDIRQAIQYLREQGPLRGLILDLRENSGGYLSQAVKVAGLFITNGIVVISKYHNGETRYYRDLDSRLFYDGPLVVLTSRGTASAAEIVAQALQDYGVALVVGDPRTYGKGSIQSQTVTKEGGISFFKVTVGKYYTVSGKTPQVRGVEADIVVPTQLIFEQFGEEFLDHPISQDSIRSIYQDSLSDVNEEIRSWFLKYYLPTLQTPKSTWREMIPLLKKNSEYRLTHNRDYQIFYDSVKAGTFPEPLQSRLQNPKYFDMQLQETISIVKDMFLLQSNFDENTIGVPTNHSQN